MEDYLFRELPGIVRRSLEETIAGQQVDSNIIDLLTRELLSTVRREIPEMCEKFYLLERTRRRGHSDRELSGVGDPSAALLIYNTNPTQGSADTVCLGQTVELDEVRRALNMNDEVSRHIIAPGPPWDQFGLDEVGIDTLEADDENWDWVWRNEERTGSAGDPHNPEVSGAECPFLWTEG